MAPVRRTFGITAFGINAYTAKTGEHVVEEHDESRLGHEEVYAVIAGRARSRSETTRSRPAGHARLLA